MHPLKRQAINNLGIEPDKHVSKSDVRVKDKDTVRISFARDVDNGSRKYTASVVENCILSSKWRLDEVDRDYDELAEGWMHVKYIG